MADTTRYIELDETLKLFRRELALTFPGTKFSIRRSRGTGYGWVSCSWTDGPTYDEVNAIASAYEGAGFCGMTDSSFRIEHTIANGNGEIETVRYGTKGINCSREISQARLVKAMRATLAAWGDWSDMARAERLQTADDETLLRAQYEICAQNGLSQTLRCRTGDVLERRSYAPDSLLAQNL